jgi:phosphopantothenate-cysteine ligase
MTHIIITAGGTIESIDGVRQITNTSTGRLSAYIYEALAEFVGDSKANHDKQGLQNQDFIVHYILSATAVRPKEKYNLPIVFYDVTDVKSVEVVLKALMMEYTIDFVIHGMAVSDFTKGYIIEREQLSKELADTLEKALKQPGKEFSFEELRMIINQVINSPAHALDSTTKVSSQSELILSLIKTPKLIEKIKIWNPETYLVGFKLLKGVTEEQLIKVATTLADKNSCDLVLANDLNNISEDNHPGLLIQNGQVIGRYSTKRDIARGIVEHILKERIEL